MSSEPHLLPGNATPQEKALSQATARVGSVANPVGTLWSPWTCPANVLPWLAWSLSVDDWSDDWSENQKRAAVASSIQVHQHKGTVGAVKRAVATLGYDVSVDEATGEIYTFAVRLKSQPDTPVPLATLDEAEQLALSAKNARSHLVAVGVESDIPQGIRIASAQVSGEQTTVWPKIVDAILPVVLLRAVAAEQSVETTDIYPNRAPYAQGEPMVTEPATYAAATFGEMHVTLTAYGNAA